MAQAVQPPVRVAVAVVLWCLSSAAFATMAERAPDTSSQLQWLLLKRWNSFYRKGLNNSRFSAEPGNVYNKHSYKYSGLANNDTVHIEATSDGSIKLVKPRRKKGNQPKSAKQVATTKKHHSKIAKSISKETKALRPDLEKATLAKLGRVHKGALAAKASNKS